MYQVIGMDGSTGEAVDLPTLKEMAGDGRLEPSTMVFDPISGQTLPAADMFVGENLFGGAVEPTSEPAPISSASLYTPVTVAQEPPLSTSPVAVVPEASQTPAPPPPIVAVSINLPQSAYPTVAVDSVPDLGQRFVGILIDGLIAMPLHALAIIPVVGIFMAPILVAYWLSRDAFFGGQSIGKRVAKTRVVRIDGMPFTWATSALRNITFVPLLGLMIPIFGIPLAHALFSPCQIADLICVLVSQRRIGDYLAQTQVVRAVD